VNRHRLHRGRDGSAVVAPRLDGAREQLSIERLLRARRGKLGADLPGAIWLSSNARD
jgi:hypothetical protein